jgi:hypothetical protein
VASDEEFGTVGGREGVEQCKKERKGEKKKREEKK